MDKQVSPFIEHARELRWRLVVALGVIISGAGACYTFKEKLFDLLISPLKTAQGGEVQLIFTSLPEFFFTYLKLSLWGGFFIGLPVLLWEVWRFIAPGLYKEEKRVVVPFIVATPFLFYLGGAFTFFVVMPLAVKFFFQFQTADVTALPSVKEYLSFNIKMIFAFGVAFNLPVFLLILAKMGIVTRQGLAKFRRYAIVCIFAAAAILTPPDPLSQAMLAVPMVILYELSIFLAAFMAKKSA